MNKKTILAKKLGINNKMISDESYKVIEKLQANGYEGYIVGGAIRDLILNYTPKDFDVVTNATPEEVKRLFQHQAIIIGRRFKIVHIVFTQFNYDKLVNNRPIGRRHIIEVSTYRSNKITRHTVSQHGKLMTDNNYGTQKDDAMRRDFTINALYYDPISEIVIDYHNGLEDIRNGLIKMIGDPAKRYTEDPVRIIRAIRLSIKLNLIIDESTTKPIAKLKHLLVNENSGRMYEEMLKILLSGSAISCVTALKEMNLPKLVFPLLDDLFLGKNIDKFAIEIINKTDNRLKNNEGTVSVVFILAGLLWMKIYTKLQKKIAKGGEFNRDTLLCIIGNYQETAYQFGIMRNVYTAIMAIWNMQHDFEYPNVEQLDELIKMNKFRQGLHLYNLRSSLNQVNKQLNEWWNLYIVTEDETIKSTLKDKLVLLLTLKS